MSGLLHDLAAQALDRAPALRPAARVRGGMSLIDAHAGTQDDGALDEFAAALPTATDDRAPIASIVVTSEAVAEAAQSAAPHVERAAALVTATRSLADIQPTAQLAARHGPPAQADVVRPAPLSGRVGKESAQASPSVRRSAEAVARDAFAAQPPALRRLALPERALSRGQAAQQAPDVHIHIGRVELTALRAPPAARRERAAPANKPIALGDYLRQRHRKSP